MSVMLPISPSLSLQGSVPFWPCALSQLTGYMEGSCSILTAAAQHGERLAGKLFGAGPGYAAKMGM